MNEDLLTLLVEKEVILHQPQHRQHSETLDKLLHKDFSEIGRSGRQYQRKEIIAFLQAESDNTIIQADKFSITHVSHDVVILTYRSYIRDENDQTSQHTLRSSVWLKVEGEDWQMRFHQGTQTKPFN